MSKLFSLSLYYISFMPLWISVLFIDLKNIIENQSEIWTERISMSCILVFCILCIIILLIELCTKRKEGTNLFQIKQVKEEKTITAEYLLSYILPLFAFDFTTWHGVILFGIFFMTLGFLCIKHNYFSVNIVLEITHFSFYDCILENEDGVPVEKIIISHRKLGGNKGDMIFVKSLNNEISLEIKQ